MFNALTQLQLIFAIAFSVAACDTYGYEPERAKNNFGHEAAECSAYFLFVSTAPGLSGETSNGLRSKYEALFKLSASFTSLELTEARTKLAVETMQREMKLDWSNLSIVNQKYGYACIDFSKDPEPRLKYWLEKKD